MAAVSASPRYFVLDDGEVDGKNIEFLLLRTARIFNISVNSITNAASQLVRVRRDDKYVAAASGGGSYGKGHVGPVYTFVKTDPKANFKWGVRHRAGVQYGRK